MHTINETIANRYRLEHKLGAGSYAETFLAEDTALNRKVAVKILRPEFTGSQEELSRFRREAQTAASIGHPNVVPVYDAGVWKNTHYLVMEWVDGTTLKHVIRTHRRLGFETAFKITDSLLAGLEAIHEAGIIHRDIKPHNILLTEGGVAKLTDFGIALTKYSFGDGKETETYGTAAYMAPEQALRVDTGPQADLYSVGVILYEMLTGRLPFIAEDPLEVIHQHVHYPVTRPKRINPNIPSSVEMVLLRALAKEPHERYASAAEMRQALSTAREEALAKAAAGGSKPRAPWLRTSAYRTRLRLATAAAAVVLMLALLAGSATLATRDFGGGTGDSSNNQIGEFPEILLGGVDPEDASGMTRREGATPIPDDEQQEEEWIPTLTPEPESEPRDIPAPSHTGESRDVAEDSGEATEDDVVAEDSTSSNEPDAVPETQNQQQPEPENEQDGVTDTPPSEPNGGQGGVSGDASSQDAPNSTGESTNDGEEPPEQADDDAHSADANNGQGPPENPGSGQGTPEHAGNGQDPPANPGNGQGQSEYSGNESNNVEEQDVTDEATETGDEGQSESEPADQGNGQQNDDDSDSSDDTSTQQATPGKSDNEPEKEKSGDGSSGSGGDSNRNKKERSNDGQDERRKSKNDDDRDESDKTRTERDDDDDDENRNRDESDDDDASNYWFNTQQISETWNGGDLDGVVARLSGDDDRDREDVASVGESEAAKDYKAGKRRDKDKERSASRDDDEDTVNEDDKRDEVERKSKKANKNGRNNRKVDNDFGEIVDNDFAASRSIKAFDPRD